MVRIPDDEREALLEAENERLRARVAELEQEAAQAYHERDEIEALACRDLDSARRTIESLTRDIRAHEHRGERGKELARLRARVAELESYMAALSQSPPEESEASDE